MKFSVKIYKKELWIWITSLHLTHWGWVTNIWVYVNQLFTFPLWDIKQLHCQVRTCMINALNPCWNASYIYLVNTNELQLVSFKNYSGCIFSIDCVHFIINTNLTFISGKWGQVHKPLPHSPVAATRNPLYMGWATNILKNVDCYTVLVEL